MMTYSYHAVVQQERAVCLTCRGLGWVLDDVRLDEPPAAYRVDCPDCTPVAPPDTREWLPADISDIEL